MLYNLQDKNLIIIDTSVIIYTVLFSAIKEYGDLFDFDNPDSDKRSKEKLLQLIDISLMSIDSLMFLPESMQDDSIRIWVADKKPYWRSAVYPEYKGERNPKPTLFTNVLSSCRKLFRPIGVTGYEADDCAAAIVKLLPETFKHTYLVTVDCDWMGLVSDSVTWLNTAMFTPRVRGVTGAYNWLLKQYDKSPKYLKESFDFPELSDFEPRFIWDFKAHFGDSSDNIKADSDSISLIDLFNPPANRMLWRKAAFKQVVERAIEYSCSRIYSRDSLAKVLDKNCFKGLNFISQEELEYAKN